MARILAHFPPARTLLFLIHNPTAGRNGTVRLARVLAALHARAVPFRLETTTEAGDGTRLARQALAAGFRRIVAAGGDGTIAELAEALCGSDAALGIIPLGTANVMAREWRLPRGPGAIAALLHTGKPTPHWPGLIHAGGQTRLFVQMCGIGFDADVVCTLAPARKRRWGRAAYVMQALHRLRRYPFPPLNLTLDGTPFTAASAIISKGRLYAGPYLLCPDARPGTPGFQVALFRHGGPAAALLYGAALPLNLLPHAPGLVRHTARVITLNTALPAQQDGDGRPPGPLTITDAPAPILLLAPPPPGTHDSVKARGVAP